MLKTYKKKKKKVERERERLLAMTPGKKRLIYIYIYIRSLLRGQVTEKINIFERTDTPSTDLWASRLRRKKNNIQNQRERKPIWKTVIDLLKESLSVFTPF